MKQILSSLFPCPNEFKFSETCVLCQRWDSNSTFQSIREPVSYQYLRLSCAQNSHIQCLKPVILSKQTIPLMDGYLFLVQVYFINIVRGVWFFVSFVYVIVCRKFALILLASLTMQQSGNLVLYKCGLFCHNHNSEFKPPILVCLRHKVVT